MEQIDLVDIHDVVIGTTDKATAHATRQIHRVAAVYVFNQLGELYVQVHKASGGSYDNSVGGHVRKGETYAAAAEREAAEELGIHEPLAYLLTFYSQGKSMDHMFGLFECTVASDWQFVPNEEVEQIIPMKLVDVRKHMRTNPEQFTSGFIHTMQQYCTAKGIH